MNLEKVTVQQCIDKYEKQKKVTILRDGKVKGFVNISAIERQEEIPTQTANPSGDE